MKFFLLINVKMPGILTFISMKNSILGLSEPKKKLGLSWYFYTYEHLKWHAQLGSIADIISLPSYHHHSMNEILLKRMKNCKSSIQILVVSLTLLHSEQPKLYKVLAVLSAIGLSCGVYPLFKGKAMWFLLFCFAKWSLIKIENDIILTLKALNKSCSRRHFIFFTFILQRK